MSEKTYLELSCDFINCEKGIYTYSDSHGYLYNKKGKLIELLKDWDDATIKGWLKFKNETYCYHCKELILKKIRNEI